MERERENKVSKTEVTIFWYPNFRKDILFLLLEMRLGVYPTQTRELSWGLGWEDPLEKGKEKATHSRVLAWRIPWIV